MSDNRQKWMHFRIVFIGALFGILFLVVTCQAFRLQILQHEEMVRKADAQHQKIVRMLPARGAILDRNGINMALSVDMESCFARPRSISNKNETANALAPVIGVNPSDLVKKLKDSRNFVWLARFLSPEQVAKVKGLRLEGIDFVPETRRYYPNLDVAAHVIGFTGSDPAGLDGVELKYNQTLLGSSDYVVTERDALGRSISMNSDMLGKQGSDKNLVLTLDKNIQHITQKELEKAVTKSRAKSGVAIVMETDTGKILAMANYPTFNPNAASRYTQFQLRNRSIADSMEPGSTMKIFLAAAALEEKLVQPAEKFNCEWGQYKVTDKVIHDTHKFGYLTLGEILKHSSNIGAAKIGFRLGRERYLRYLRNFGFGEKTGIDLPGESVGNIHSNRRWYDLELATISFGQGVTVSPIQLLTATSAVANGGNLMKPYVVEKIVDGNGTVIRQFLPQIVRRVISEETSRKMAAMLETVTADDGTGVNAALKEYRVAGKTGTSQKADQITRGYSEKKRIASFVGYLPADKPKLSILVIVDEPATSQYGGIVAAPAFRQIAQDTIAYLKIPPDTKHPSSIQVKRDAASKIAEKDTVSDGDGLVSSIVMEGGETSTRMPDFRNMSIRQVMQVMQKSNINIRLIGSGRAVTQKPEPGAVIKESGEVWVKFTPST